MQVNDRVYYLKVDVVVLEFGHYTVPPLSVKETRFFIFVESNNQIITDNAEAIDESVLGLGLFLISKSEHK